MRRITVETLDNLKPGNTLRFDIYREVYDKSVGGDSKSCAISVTVLGRTPEKRVRSPVSKNGILKFRYLHSNGKEYWYRFEFGTRGIFIQECIDEYKDFPTDKPKYQIAVTFIGKQLVEFLDNRHRKRRKDAGTKRPPIDPSRKISHRRWRGMTKSDQQIIAEIGKDKLAELKKKDRIRKAALQK